MSPLPVTIWGGGRETVCTKVSAHRVELRSQGAVVAPIHADIDRLAALLQKALDLPDPERKTLIGSPGGRLNISRTGHSVCLSDHPSWTAHAGITFAKDEIRLLLDALTS